MKLTMAAKTPAQWKTLFENVPFHRENYYTGPLGPDYTPGGTCLRLWAPTAEAVTVTLYHKGDGGAVLGTKPLVRGAQGVWSIWLPGEQHGRYYTFAVTVDGITRETGDPYARAGGLNGLRSMIVDLARTAPAGWERAKSSSLKPRACMTAIASASPSIRVLTVLEVGARCIGQASRSTAISSTAFAASASGEVDLPVIASSGIPFSSSRGTIRSSSFALPE